MLSGFISIIKKNRAIFSAITVLLFVITVMMTGCRKEEVFEEVEFDDEQDTKSTEKSSSDSTILQDTDNSREEVPKHLRLSLDEIRLLSAHSVVDAELLSDDEIDTLFYSSEIDDEIFMRINNVSYRENNNITIEQLRYIRVLHVGFDEKTYIGELIVNSDISEDILEIMRELYRAKYPIESMILVDEYGADDDKSMEANNTSAFNYRTISGTSVLSNHSYGLAIDINPLYNPYIVKKSDSTLTVSPDNAEKYTDRSKDFLYKIDHNDLCCKLFIQHGFTWGGDWNGVKDYQHFEWEK